jgi:hypothetical protein
VRTRLSLLTAVFALLLAGSATADVKPGAATKSSGPVEATLGWSAGDIWGEHPQLIIRRDGEQKLDVALEEECRACSVIANPGDDALYLQDLDGDGDPEVFVDTYSGGAHCCTIVPIYRWDGAAGRYRRLTAFFGNAGFTLDDLDHDGRPEFVTSDDRFSYRFTAYAFSARPPLVLAYGTNRDGKVALRDVTAGFPQLVRDDARAWLRELPRARKEGDPRGIVAAYVADLWLLGRKGEANRFLRRALRRGDLRSQFADDTLWKSGRAYIRDLKRFLRRHGY